MAGKPTSVATPGVAAGHAAVENKDESAAKPSAEQEQPDAPAEQEQPEAEVDENEDIGHTVLTINANDKDECEYDIYQDMFYPLIFSTSSFKTPLRNHKRQFWRSVFCEQNNWGYQCGWTH